VVSVPLRFRKIPLRPSDARAEDINSDDGRRPLYHHRAHFSSFQVQNSCHASRRDAPAHGQNNLNPRGCQAYRTNHPCEPFIGSEPLPGQVSAFADTLRPSCHEFYTQVLQFQAHATRSEKPDTYPAPPSSADTPGWPDHAKKTSWATELRAQERRHPGRSTGTDEPRARATVSPPARFRPDSSRDI